MSITRVTLNHSPACASCWYHAQLRHTAARQRSMCRLYHSTLQNQLFSRRIQSTACVTNYLDKHHSTCVTNKFDKQQSTRVTDYLDKHHSTCVTKKLEKQQSTDQLPKAKSIKEKFVSRTYSATNSLLTLQIITLNQLISHFKLNNSFPPLNSQLMMDAIKYKINTHYFFYSLYLLVLKQLRLDNIYNAIGSLNNSESHYSHIFYSAFLSNLKSIPPSLLLKFIRTLHARFLSQSLISSILAHIPLTFQSRLFLESLFDESIQKRRLILAKSIHNAFPSININAFHYYTLLTQFKEYDTAMALLETKDISLFTTDALAHSLFHHVKEYDLQNIKKIVLKINQLQQINNSTGNIQKYNIKQFSIKKENNHIDCKKKIDLHENMNLNAEDIMKINTQIKEDIMNLDTNKEEDIMNLDTNKEEDILNLDTNKGEDIMKIEEDIMNLDTQKEEDIMNLYTQKEEDIMKIDTQKEEDIMKIDTVEDTEYKGNINSDELQIPISETSLDSLTVDIINDMDTTPNIKTLYGSCINLSLKHHSIQNTHQISLHLIPFMTPTPHTFNKLLYFLTTADMHTATLEQFKLHETHHPGSIQDIGMTSIVKSFLALGQTKEAMRSVKGTDVESCHLILQHHAKQSFQAGLDALQLLQQKTDFIEHRRWYTALLSSTHTVTQVELVRQLAREAWEKGEYSPKNDSTLMNEDARWIDTLIHTYGRHSLPEQAELLAKYYVTLNYTPTLHTFTSLLVAWCQVGHYKRAVQWYDWMRQGYKYIQPNLLIYNTLLFGVQRDEKMSLEHVKQQVEKWITCIRTEGLIPDLATYHTLISFHIMNNDPSSMEKILQEMFEKGINMGPATYIKVIQAYSKLGDEKNVYKWYTECTENHSKIMTTKQLSSCWRAMMKMFQERGEYDAMIKLVSEIVQDERFEVNDVFMGQMAMLLVKVKQQDTLYKIITKDLNAIQDSNLKNILSKINLSQKGVLSVAYSVLLNDYADRKEYEKGIALCHIMKHSDTCDYLASILMKLCGRAHYNDECDALWLWTNALPLPPHLQNGKLSYLLSVPYKKHGPDASTTSLYIDALGYRGDLKKVDDVWRYLTSLDCVHVKTVRGGRWPDENVYNSYIEALCRCGAYAKAVKCFERMGTKKDGMDLSAVASEKTVRTLVTPLKDAKKTKLLARVTAHCKKIGIGKMLF